MTFKITKKSFGVSIKFLGSWVKSPQKIFSNLKNEKGLDWV